MLIEMVSMFSSLHKSLKRLFIFLPLIIGLLINPISANALYPSDPSSVDVLKDDLHGADLHNTCLLYTSPSPRDPNRSRMPSSA